MGDIPAWALEDSDDDDDHPNGDIELQDTKSNNNHIMDTFFQQVDAIKADIDAVHTATTTIGRINEESMRATTTVEEQKLSTQLKPLIQNTNQRAQRTKQVLKLLKEETDTFRQEERVKDADLRYERDCCFIL